MSAPFVMVCSRVGRRCRRWTRPRGRGRRGPSGSSTDPIASRRPLPLTSRHGHRGRPETGEDPDMPFVALSARPLPSTSRRSGAALLAGLLVVTAAALATVATAAPTNAAAGRPSSGQAFWKITSAGAAHATAYPATARSSSIVNAMSPERVCICSSFAQRGARPHGALALTGRQELGGVLHSHSASERVRSWSSYP